MNDRGITVSVHVQHDTVRLALVNCAGELTEVTFTDANARMMIAESCKALCNVADIAAAIERLAT